MAILINTLLAVHCNFLYFSQRKCRPWIREKLAAEMPVMRDRSWWFARRHLYFPIFLPPSMLPVGWQLHLAVMWRHIANPNKRYYENSTKSNVDVLFSFRCIIWIMKYSICRYLDTFSHVKVFKSVKIIPVCLVLVELTLVEVRYKCLSDRRDMYGR